MALYRGKIYRPRWAKDDWLTGSLHPGTTSFREIPARRGCFDCPPGRHVVIDNLTGERTEHIDRFSPAAYGPGGFVQLDPICGAMHGIFDVLKVV